jgi:hypothetical protein
MCLRERDTERNETMTTTKKTTKAPKAKKLLLTSRAKMGAARETKKARAEQITHELVEAGTNPQAAPVIAEVMAQVPASMDLDGTAEAPTLAETIRAPAEPEQTAQGVVLTPELGTGWFHLDLDGVRIGCVFKTTVRVADGAGGTKGAVRWKAQQGLARIKLGEDRISATGLDRAAAVEEFVRAYRGRKEP